MATVHRHRWDIVAWQPRVEAVCGRCGLRRIHDDKRREVEWRLDEHVISRQPYSRERVPVQCDE